MSQDQFDTPFKSDLVPSAPGPEHDDNPGFRKTYDRSDAERVADTPATPAQRPLSND